MLQSRSKVFRPTIRLGRLEIQIPRARRRVIRKNRVKARDFACIRSHAAARLAALDVSPHKRRHIPLIIHESRIKIWSLVRVRRRDMRGAAREGILEKMKLREVFAGRDVHVVAVKAGDHGVVHHGLVGFGFEVAVPARPKFVAGPLVHARELGFCRPDLDAGFDAVGAQGAAACDVPFFEDAFLYFRVA